MSDRTKATLVVVSFFLLMTAFFTWTAMLPPDQPPTEVKQCAHIMCLGERLGEP